MVNSLLDSNIIPLMNSLIIFYKKRNQIVLQCVSSMNLLSLTIEGNKYLQNEKGLIDNLQDVLDLYYSSTEISIPLLAILERLGCINVRR